MICSTFTNAISARIVGLIGRRRMYYGVVSHSLQPLARTPKTPFFFNPPADGENKRLSPYVLVSSFKSVVERIIAIDRLRSSKTILFASHHRDSDQNKMLCIFRLRVCAKYSDALRSSFAL